MVITLNLLVEVVVESEWSDVGTDARKKRTNRNTEHSGMEVVELSAKILPCGGKANVWFILPRMLLPALEELMGLN